ncbi:hypothetical protein Drorol1_Dr00024699 [Drosera rotundifolia]
MADNNDLTINGVDDDSAVIDFNHSPAAKKTDDLDHLLAKIESLENKNHESNRRIENLESENDSLSKSNLSLLKSKDDAERKIEELESEIEMVKKEVLERADEERKAVDSIVKRVGELESEVVRLQHDLAAAEKEAERLRGELEKLRGEKGRMEEEVRRVRVLEKEKEELTHEVNGLVEKCAKLSVKSEESVAQVDELMKKVVLPEGEEENKGFKISLPVVGAVSGVVIVAVLGVACLKYSRRA